MCLISGIKQNLVLLGYLCFCGVGIGMYFWHINIYQKVDHCIIDGYACILNNNTLSISLVPMLRVKYSFKGKQHNLIKTNRYDKYQIFYSKPTPYTDTDYINSCLMTSSYYSDTSFGYELQDCYTTPKYPISKDECICRSTTSTFEDTNSCCDYGFNKIEPFIIVSIILFIIFIIFIYFSSTVIKKNGCNIKYLTPTILKMVYIKYFYSAKKIHPKIKTTVIYNNSDECPICTINQTDIILMPCGHKCICDECYNLLENKRCPICKINIEYTIDIKQENLTNI
jgi:hypothetical protein